MDFRACLPTNRYNQVVTRACAVVLLGLFAFSLIPSGLFADAGSNLPACCRRDGKHGCSMKNMTAVKEEPSGTAIKSSPKCPFFPKAGAAPGTGKAGAPRLARVAFAFALKAVLRTELAEAQYRVSFSRGWQKRGPPSLLS
jgi:hypothetical protein